MSKNSFVRNKEGSVKHGRVMLCAKCRKPLGYRYMMPAVRVEGRGGVEYVHDKRCP